jgi:hypothetical protein
LVYKYLEHFQTNSLSFGIQLAFYLPYKPNLPLKTKMIPPNKLAMLSAAVCAVMLAFTDNASADATLGFIPDTHVVGTISPGAPASPDAVKDYVNFMIGLGCGQSVAHDFGQPEGVQTVFRSNNTFGSLPTASGVGAKSGTGTTIDLNVLGTFTYLFAKYDGQNDDSFVWNISDLTGVITIPGFGPKGKGLSGWILFGPTSVPDGGATVMLLGAALGALGLVRRYLMI